MFCDAVARNKVCTFSVKYLSVGETRSRENRAVNNNNNNIICISALRL